MKKVVFHFLLLVFFSLPLLLPTVGLAQGVICGDGFCKAPEENCANCQVDCGPCKVDICGDGVCRAPEENCANCSTDCGPCKSVLCGDGQCVPPETCASCEVDCGVCS